MTSQANSQPPAQPKEGQMALPMGAVVQTSKSTIYPFAEDLEAYNRAFPNGAERLFNSFESQGQHRQQLEDSVVKSNIRQAERGQLIGFGTIIIALGVGLYAALKGHDIFGGTVVTVVLAGGFSVFITGKVQQRRDLNQKREAAKQAGAD
jgi:uncharacterized membrane protein